MHLVLIRHGEQDYTFTEGRGFPGPARELAPLTEKVLPRRKQWQKIRV